jgi:hypothetical protein
MENTTPLMRVSLCIFLRFFRKNTIIKHEITRHPSLARHRKRDVACEGRQRGLPLLYKTP